MASITCFGTWVPAGPSRKAAAWPFTFRFREGNCSRTQAVSSGLVSVSCTTGVLMIGPQGEVDVFASRVVSHKAIAKRIAPMQVDWRPMENGAGLAVGLIGWQPRVPRQFSAFAAGLDPVVKLSTIIQCHRTTGTR